MKNDELTTVEIYSGTVLECEILKSILADAEIECLFKNYVGTDYGFNSPNIESVRVMVLESDYPLAKVIAEEFKNNISDKKK